MKGIMKPFLFNVFALFATVSVARADFYIRNIYGATAETAQVVILKDDGTSPTQVYTSSDGNTKTVASSKTERVQVRFLTETGLTNGCVVAVVPNGAYLGIDISRHNVTVAGSAPVSGLFATLVLGAIFGLIVLSPLGRRGGL